MLNISLAYESMCAKGAETYRKIDLHQLSHSESMFEMGQSSGRYLYKQPITLSFWFRMRLDADLQSSPFSSDLFDQQDILLQLLGTAVLVFGAVGSRASQVEKAEARLQGKGFLDVGS